MVSSQNAFNGLSTELVTIIIALLQFPDICSLRLVSRTFPAKCSQSFEKHFRTKTLQWTSSKQLEEFVHLTQPNGLGCLLQHLTIVGVAPVIILRPRGRRFIATAPALRPFPIQQASTNGKLLTDAFTNLRLNPASGGLQSLVLRVEGQDTTGNSVACEGIREWEPLWQTAALTFEIFLPALAASALPVEELDIFRSVLRCSLGCDKIAPILDRIDLSKSLERLKSLSLSVSLPLLEPPDSESLESAKRHSNSVGRLLKLCPQLEKLELHWFTIVPRIGLHKYNEAQIEERGFFTHVVELGSFSQLRSCKLEGIHTDETTLLAFFQKATQLASISMEHFVLPPSGKFRPTFDFITSHLEHLEYLHLEDLYERRRICFDGPGRPNGPSALTRVGDENRQRRRAIGYRKMRGIPSGEIEETRRHERLQLHYGPP
jgi:hypothetical protein